MVGQYNECRIMPTRRGFIAGAAGSLTLRAGLAESDTVRAVVAADGSGDFASVQRAVDHVLDRGPSTVTRVILEIRAGVYRERVKIPRDRPNLTLRGADAASTLIAASMSAGQAGGTFFSPIVEIDGDGFAAENISFENTFGTGSQAVALSIHSDRAVFSRCRFLGWQDTLYAASGRQYYRDCRIEGHVDFIFGNAAAVFDHCEVHSRASGYVAAQSRTRPDELTGFVFRDCRLTGAPDAQVFLARPWRSCSRVVFVDCWMGRQIRAEGWNNWGNPANEETAWFGEFGCVGPGATPEKRAHWARTITPAEAASFQPVVFLRGTDDWHPPGIPTR